MRKKTTTKKTTTKKSTKKNDAAPAKKARSRKTRAKKSEQVADQVPEHKPDRPDDVLEGYDDEGRPIWRTEGIEDGESTDGGEVVPLRVEDGGADGEGAAAEDEQEQAKPRERRPHPLVAEMMREHDRIVPMEDYDEDRPRTEGFAEKLTAEEKAGIGDSMAREMEELDQLKAANAIQKKAMKQAEDEKEDKIRRLRSRYRDGTELRQRPVQRVAFLGENVSRLIRLDTGEVVKGRDRVLTSAEREELLQLPLPWQAEAADAVDGRDEDATGEDKTE